MPRKSGIRSGNLWIQRPSSVCNGYPHLEQTIVFFPIMFSRSSAIEGTLSLRQDRQVMTHSPWELRFHSLQSVLSRVLGVPAYDSILQSDADMHSWRIGRKSQFMSCQVLVVTFLARKVWVLPGFAIKNRMHTRVFKPDEFYGD